VIPKKAIIKGGYMKKNCVLMMLVLFLVGCAAGRTQIVQPKKQSFSSYEVLEICDFKNNAGAKVPAQVSQRVPDELAEKVAALNLFGSVNRVPVVTGEDPQSKILCLEGTIVEYDPGSRGKRWFAGFTGWGKGFITVQLTAVEKASKSEVFKGNIGSELSGGFFGGSFDGAIEKLVDESVSCIQMNY
jgi:hypothetical protein